MTGPRPKSLNLAGIVLGYAAKQLLIIHRNFEGTPPSFRFFRGGPSLTSAIARSRPILRGTSSLLVSGLCIFPCTPNRLLAKTSAKATLLSSFCTSCKLEQLLPRPDSHPFCASGKLTVSPDQAYFNAEEELRRLVWSNFPYHRTSTEVIDRLKHPVP